jgi:16S rRNA (guanine527-N7)-methyltransferase
VAHPSVRARLDQLQNSWDLPADAAERFERLLALVSDERSAITTVRHPADGVELHVADSLAGLDVPAIREATTIADLGSGGGFPGLALAIALPETRVALVETVGKKCDFLRRSAEALGLDNVDVVHARAEEWAAGMGRQDVVTARALAPLNVIAEYAAPLLREGGVLAAWKGTRQDAEEADGRCAAAVLGLEPTGVYAASDVRGVDARHLHLYVKVRATPSRYPRRAGMARKRPVRP